jgi:4,5-dihydroxyphthalate decarboxylase
MSKRHKDLVVRQDLSIARRDFLKIASAAGVLSIPGVAYPSTLLRNNLPISMAGYDYDRVQALIDGRVKIEGCDTRFEVSQIGEMNTHILAGPQTREVTEIGLNPFMLAYANDNFRDYTLIPVFPLRVFRHKSIFIRTDRGIEEPADLRGKKIATPGYSSTSLTWIRGIMQDEYGVSPKDVQWVISSKDSAAKESGGPSKQENILPEGLSVLAGPAGLDESDLLESGDVDALYHAAEPRAFIEGNPKIARLFSDSRATEQAYFEKTGIFPIMHAVAIRKDVLEQNPWLIEAVFNAYAEAKRLTYDFLLKAAWYKTTLPWVKQEVEDTRALMGENFWPYGIEPNRNALNALFRYSYEQGLCDRQLTIEELFHPSGLELNDL